MESSTNLVCNSKKCIIILKESAFLTSCSHIFCIEHGKEIQQTSICLACSNKLNNNDRNDFKVVNLKPNDKKKEMMLAGLKPQEIIDIASRGIDFYMYQINYQLQLKDNLMKQIEKKYQDEVINIGTNLQANNLKHKRDIENLKKERHMRNWKEMEMAGEIRKLKDELQSYKKRSFSHDSFVKVEENEPFPVKQRNYKQDLYNFQGCDKKNKPFDN